MKRNKRIILSLCAVILILLIAWIVWGNTALEINEYTVLSDEIGDGFDGYRIAHISDLHNTYIEKLIPMLEGTNPDLIAITGDLIDSRKTDMDTALDFVNEAIKIAPCYYVTGNHESRIPEYDQFKTALTELGVVVLDNRAIEIESVGDVITLIGIDDPMFESDYTLDMTAPIIHTKLQNISYNSGFNVLLSHRPDTFDVYVQNDLDLVLSGHAHGGQFRLPLVGGIYTIDQGLFPEYDSGIHIEENTHMIVSRGIGNSVIPFRINNRPEIIIVELSKTE